jgi:hypothetical protein
MNEILVLFIFLGFCGAVVLGTYIVCSIVFKIKNYFYEKNKAQFYRDNPQAKVLDEEVTRTFQIKYELYTKQEDLKRTIVKYYQEERIFLTRAKRNHKDAIMENLKAELETVKILYEIALKNHKKACNNRMELGDNYYKYY